MKLEDFKEFFKNVNGYNPFLWQIRLMEEVMSKGWPSIISMPTSAGKTSVLDIALFNLAAQAELSPAERTAPVRIIYIVDRRVVVDEAFERAMRIKRAVEEASEDSGILFSVGVNLKKINMEENHSAVDVIRMRGGLPREKLFISDPLKPTIIISTVDQIGSRILFSGYGVSDSMKPVHAALVGADSLIVLDEAHLSRPFSETLARVSEYEGGKWHDVPVAKPLKFVEMSATPHSETGSVFKLSDDDLRDVNLSIRITCEKPTELIDLKIRHDSMKDARRFFCEQIVSESVRIMKSLSDKSPSPPTVGIMVNTVATAREVFELLPESPNYDKTLLIGRNRPYANNSIMNSILPRIKSDRKPEDNGKPLFVVSTQSLEVGADVDFDGLVTQAASYDSLRQRFGRLNRLGKRPYASGVIIKPDYGKLLPLDPVYGDAEDETWKWLVSSGTRVHKKGAATIDMGSIKLDSIKPEPQSLAKMLLSAPLPPVLTPSQMDILIQTNPAPAIHPHIPFFLHGAEKQQEDVQVVWRANIPELIENESDDYIIKTIASLPPSHGETISIPLRALVSFLNANIEENVADVEGLSTSERSPTNNRGRYAVRWRGPDESQIVDPDEILPGDVIVIPASYGGADIYGWNPESGSHTDDIAEISRLWEDGTSPLRIQKVLARGWFNKGDNEASIAKLENIIDDGLQRYREGEDIRTISSEIIEAIIAADNVKQEILALLNDLREDFTVYVYPDLDNVLGMVLASMPKTNSAEFTDEDDTSSIAMQVTLERHSMQVAQKAQDYANLTGLPVSLVSDVALAGKFHDLGKADPRFQTWLRGGESGVESEELLAKSGHFIVNDRVSMERSRYAAGLPRGLRHECYSYAIVVSNESMIREAYDRDLVLYLVGTHHGYGRPLHKSVKDEGIENLLFNFDGKQLSFKGTHRLDFLDSGWPELFWSLNRKYGYWGLAYLETLVRLSDHEVSRSYANLRRMTK